MYDKVSLCLGCPTDMLILDDTSDLVVWTV